MEYLPHFDTAQTIIICSTLAIFSIIGYRVAKRANNCQKTAKRKALKLLVLGCAIPVISVTILYAIFGGSLLLLAVFTAVSSLVPLLGMQFMKWGDIFHREMGLGPLEHNLSELALLFIINFVFDCFIVTTRLFG
jgi:hypothetical protein